jgi:hypothetical protein
VKTQKVRDKPLHEGSHMAGTVGGGTEAVVAIDAPLGEFECGVDFVKTGNGTRCDEAEDGGESEQGGGLLGRQSRE